MAGPIENGLKGAETKEQGLFEPTKLTQAAEEGSLVADSVIKKSDAILLTEARKWTRKTRGCREEISKPMMGHKQKRKVEILEFFDKNSDEVVPLGKKLRRVVEHNFESIGGGC